MAQMTGTYTEKTLSVIFQQQQASNSASEIRAILLDRGKGNSRVINSLVKLGYLASADTLEITKTGYDNILSFVMQFALDMGYAPEHMERGYVEYLKTQLATGGMRFLSGDIDEWFTERAKEFVAKFEAQDGEVLPNPQMMTVKDVVAQDAAWWASHTVKRMGFEISNPQPQPDGYLDWYRFDALEGNWYDLYEQELVAVTPKGG